MESSTIQKIAESIKRGHGLIESIVILVTVVPNFIALLMKSKIALFIGLSLILLFIILFLFYLYIKRYYGVITIKIQVPDTVKGIIRGLHPFQKGDVLLGRTDERAIARTIVVNPSFEFGFISGDAGAGKTSFIRAVLLDDIESSGMSPIYIPSPKGNPLETIRLFVQRNYGIQTDSMDLPTIFKSIRKENKKILLIIDQFEEFFIYYKTHEERLPFIEQVWKLLKDPFLNMGIILSLRKEFIGELYEFQSELVIPQPTDSKYYIKLSNWSKHTARREVLQCAITDNELSFSPALADEVINDLATDGMVRPVEFQLVTRALKEKNVTTEMDYYLLGRASGILASFIKENIEKTTTTEKELEKEVSRMVLHLLCDELNDTKKPIGLTKKEFYESIKNTIENSDKKNLMPDDSSFEMVLTNVINKFLNEFILVNEDQERFNLAHDYIVKYIRLATTGMESSEERANKMLKYYLQEQKTLTQNILPLKKYRYIKKFANGELKLSPDAKKLLKRSIRVYSAYASFIVLMVLGLAYIVLPEGYCYDTEDVFMSDNSINWTWNENKIISSTPEDGMIFWEINNDKVKMKKLNDQGLSVEFSNDGNWICSINGRGGFLRNIKDTSVSVIGWRSNKKQIHDYSFDEVKSEMYGFEGPHDFCYFDTNGDFVNINFSNISIPTHKSITLDKMFEKDNFIPDSSFGQYIHTANLRLRYESRLILLEFSEDYFQVGTHKVHEKVSKNLIYEDGNQSIIIGLDSVLANAMILPDFGLDNMVFAKVDSELYYLELISSDYKNRILHLSDFQKLSLPNKGDKKIIYSFSFSKLKKTIILFTDTMAYILNYSQPKHLITLDTAFSLYKKLLPTNGTSYENIMDTSSDKILLTTTYDSRRYLFIFAAKPNSKNIFTQISFENKIKVSKSDKHNVIGGINHTKFSPDDKHLAFFVSIGYPEINDLFTYTVDSCLNSYYQSSNYTDFSWCNDNQHIYAYNNNSIFYGLFNKELEMLKINSLVGAIQHFSFSENKKTMFVFTNHGMFKIKKRYKFFGIPIIDGLYKDINSKKIFASHISRDEIK